MVSQAADASRSSDGHWDYDIVIAGGGLAGLSLAGQLAKTLQPDQRMLLIDDARRPVADRAWGYWSSSPGLLDSQAGTSWSYLDIHAGGQALHLQLSAHLYRLIKGATLAEATSRLIAVRPSFSTLTAQVNQITDGEHAASVVTDGPTITGRWVFDSVTDAPVSAAMVLTFLGWRIRCERPVFDPDTVTLLDFRIPQREGARFVYLLPTSPCEALIEHTSYLPVDLPAADAASEEAAAIADLDDYLRQVRHVASYRILDSECGTLDLGDLREHRRHTHVIPIGLTGGLLKPSTGYAYTRIQRDSAAIAASLSAHGDPFHRPHARRRFRFLDRVFLQAIRTDPALLPIAFAAMFTANPPDRILRFLDEESTPAAEARLIASLPRIPCLTAARRLARRLP